MLVRVSVRPTKYLVPVEARSHEDYVICLSGKRKRLRGGILPCLPKEVCIKGKCEKVEYELIEASLAPFYVGYKARILGKEISGSAKAEGPLLMLYDPFENAYVPFSKVEIRNVRADEKGIAVEFSTGPFTHLNVRIEVFSLDWNTTLEESNSGFAYLGLDKPWGFARVELFSPYWEPLVEKEVYGNWIGLEKRRKWLTVAGCLGTDKVRVKNVLLKPKRVSISCQTGKTVKIEKSECVKKTIFCLGKISVKIWDEVTNLPLEFTI